jgi:hypothetical protein
MCASGLTASERVGKLAQHSSSATDRVVGDKLLRGKKLKEFAST